MVEDGLTLRVAGLEAIPVWVTPSDQVRLHGPVPVSAAWIVAEAPAQIVPPPLTVAVGLGLTVSVPVFDAKSLEEVAAWTVKLVDPAGVELVVFMNNVPICTLSLALKWKGFGEKDAVAPVGNGVVTLRVALNAPAEPLPLPLFTSTV